MTTWVAVDAMGGDHGPETVVPGAIAGARHHGVGLRLVGREPEIRAALDKADASSVPIEVIHASETIDMGDHPAQSVRRKRDSSIMVALHQVKNDSAQVMLSAGNSGAVMAGALLALGRIPGIDRPAISTAIPNIKGTSSLLLDLGAVTDPRPTNMVQWAMMGQVYAQSVMDIHEPTVGLVSNGEEPGKGNALVQAVHALMLEEPGLNFYGNVEGRDIASGLVDIYVMDGFTGNVVLKTMEGTALMLNQLVRAEVTATPLRKMAALILRPAFRSVSTRLDYSAIGGAPLLGVDGAVIIAHGRSNELAIQNAIGVCKRAVEHRLNQHIRERAAQLETA